jgi:hypothetical protein
MFALLFLILGVVILLAAAGRIWIDVPPLDSPIVDSTLSNGSSEAASVGHMSAGKDLVA